MKSAMLYCLLYLIVCITSCRNKERTQMLPAAPVSNIGEAPQSITVRKNVLARRGTAIAVEAMIDTPLHSKVIYLESKEAGTLIGELVTMHQPGNIRFEKIIDPFNKTDGPFGKHFEYQASHTGTYKIILGSSHMAENPFKGKVNVNLKLE